MPYKRNEACWLSPHSPYHPLWYAIGVSLVQNVKRHKRHCAKHLNVGRILLSNRSPSLEHCHCNKKCHSWFGATHKGWHAPDLLSRILSILLLSIIQCRCQQQESDTTNNRTFVTHVIRNICDMKCAIVQNPISLRWGHLLCLLLCDARILGSNLIYEYCWQCLLSQTKNGRHSLSKLTDSV